MANTAPQSNKFEARSYELRDLRAVLIIKPGLPPYILYRDGSVEPNVEVIYGNVRT